MTYDVSRTLRTAVLWRVAALVLGLGFVASVPVFVSPDAFGRFNIVFSAAQVLAAALLIWPNQGFLRQAREELHESGGFPGSLAARLALHLGLSALFIVIVILSSGLLAEWLEIDRWLVAACVVMLALAQSTTEIGIIALQARARFESFNAAPIFQRAGQLCGLAAIILAGDAETVPDAWVLLVAGTIVGYLVSGMNAWSRVPTALDRVAAGNRMRRIITYSWTLPVTSMAAFMLAWIDIWMINALLGIDSAGVYSFAYLVTTLATAILVPIVAALLPRSIDHEIAGDGAEGIRVRARILAATLLAGALAPLGVVLMAATLAVMPLGDYAPARLSLVLLCTGIVFQLAMALGESIIYTRADLVRRYALVVIMMLVTNASVNVLLIPQIGIEGAAIATVATYAFGMFAQWALLAMPGSRIGLLAFTASGFLVALVLFSGSLPALVAAGLVTAIGLCAAGWIDGRFTPILLLLPERLRRLSRNLDMKA